MKNYVIYDALKFIIKIWKCVGVLSGTESILAKNREIGLVFRRSIENSTILGRQYIESPCTSQKTLRVFRISSCRNLEIWIGKKSRIKLFSLHSAVCTTLKIFLSPLAIIFFIFGSFLDLTRQKFSAAKSFPKNCTSAMRKYAEI